MVYGYHRTSTTEQHLDRGVNAIRNYCSTNAIKLDEMFTDQQTGKNFDRPDYLTLKRMAKNKGDIIILSEIDRLGRNKEDTLKELRHFKDVGVRVMILEIPTTLIDYSAHGDTLSSMLMETINNMLIEMYATFAHAEMLKRETRQAEGIQAKKDRGEWEDYGRPPIITDSEFINFCELYLKHCDEGRNATTIMSILNLRKTSFYKYRKLCIDNNFERLYQKVKEGKIMPNDCMSKLGLKEKEYNEYVSGLTCKITPNPVPTATTPTTQTVMQVQTNESLYENDLQGYVEDVKKQLISLYNDYISAPEMLKYISEYLGYLPSLNELNTEELQQFKSQLEENLSILYANVPPRNKNADGISDKPTPPTQNAITMETNALEFV